ncbi:hypothetical protein K449DRAFT_394862 [Hypoxylon sp. EC38]|nr:hypothetical protein K449DRAFT_394862 [Hypoxylon sp. EC38]
MAVEISPTCNECGLRRGFWHIPTLVAEFFYSASESGEPIDVPCLTCQIKSEDGIIEALSAIERAQATTFRENPEWTGVHKVLGDLLYYLGRIYGRFGSLPSNIDRQLVKTVYRWKDELFLDVILQPLTARFHHEGEQWRGRFLRRLAQFDLDLYFNDLIRAFDNDEILKDFEDSTERLRLRLKVIRTPADLKAFFREVDRQFETHWNEPRSHLVADLRLR